MQGLDDHRAPPYVVRRQVGRYGGDDELSWAVFPSRRGSRPAIVGLDRVEAVAWANTLNDAVQRWSEGGRHDRHDRFGGPCPGQEAHAARKVREGDARKLPGYARSLGMRVSPVAARTLVKVESNPYAFLRRAHDAEVRRCMRSWSSW